MKAILCLLALLLCVSTSDARTREVGNGREYPSLQTAAADAQPGDTILIREGIYGSAGHIVNLQGTEQAYIVIRAAQSETVIFRGGSNGIQFSDPAYLRIEGLIFEGQTGNGVNIDDGGTYETPAHEIRIKNCEWRALDANGNNDQLKLSGVRQFSVDSCKFLNGAAGGSAVDMVGCYSGLFRNNLFQDAGSNSIQAKGGSEVISITANRFIRGGQRAINIGGSTDRAFFRPPDADYEASRIVVRSNIFEGSMAPIAFVGAIGSSVTNNTIIRPERWAVRILQENVEGMQPCSSNEFYNNIIVFTSQQPAFNIGGNTSPETFVISHNLWYNPDNTSWSGPNTPVNEFGRILNQDPLFIDTEYRIASNSPAYRSGRDLSFFETDFFGNNFYNPPSMGAVEAQASSVDEFHSIDGQLIASPNPTSGTLFMYTVASGSEVRIVDLLGRIVLQGELDDRSSIDLSHLPAAYYTIAVGNKQALILKQ